ncbi:MAG: SPFH domain-containing protein [Candidatus Beckwithbacteria bacterium]|nr:SPFH domain-containing protein [Candidatus Beckwithbacteria bacterium]
MEFDKLVVSFLADEVVGGFFVNVPPGHVACIHDLGRGVLKKVKGPGLHLKIPFWQRAKLFNAQILEYLIRHDFDLTYKEAMGDEAITGKTSDGKNIQLEGSILFKIDKTRANELWETIGENFISKIVRPVSRSRIRSVLSEVSLNQLTSYRTQVEEKIKKELNNIFSKSGIICDGFLLSELKDLGVLKTTSDDKVIFKEEKSDES